MNETPAPHPDSEAAAPEAPEPSFWAEVRRGISGDRRDFTRGSLVRAVVLLAIPMVLEMTMQSTFAVVDIFFVGKLGPNAVAAVGMTDSILTLIFAVAMGLAMAAAAMVARRIGEKKPEEAAVAAVQAIGLGVLVALGLGLPGMVFAKELLGLMGASREVIDGGWGFTAIMLGTNLCVVLLFLINAVFRGAGDAVIAMRVLWLANLCNIVLDPLLIFGWGPIPAFGIEGAAVATVIGRSIGVAYQVRELRRGRGHLAIRREHLRAQLAVVRRLVSVASTGILQYLIGTASWLGVMRLVAIFGSAALAGYTIAIRVIIFALLPAWGISNAAATLVGQNLGARQADRAERSVWVTAGLNMIFLGSVAVVFTTLTEAIVGVFASEPDVLAVGVQCLRTVSFSYVFLAVGMVTVQSFNGAGDTATPTWINFFCYWLFQIPVAWFAAVVLGLGTRGIFGTIAVTQTMLAVVGVLLFRRGRWKSKVI